MVDEPNDDNDEKDDVPVMKVAKDEKPESSQEGEKKNKNDEKNTPSNEKDSSKDEKKVMRVAKDQEQSNDKIDTGDETESGDKGESNDEDGEDGANDEDKEKPDDKTDDVDKNDDFIKDEEEDLFVDENVEEELDDVDRWVIEDSVPDIRQKHKSDIAKIEDLVGEEVGYEELEIEKHLIGPVETLLTHVKDENEISTEIVAIVEVLQRMSQAFKQSMKEREKVKDKLESMLSDLQGDIQGLKEMKQKERELEQLHEDMRQILNLLSVQDNPFVDSDQMTADLRKGFDNQNKEETSKNESNVTDVSQENSEPSIDDMTPFQESIDDFIVYVEGSLGENFLGVVEYLSFEGWVDEKLKNSLISNYHKLGYGNKTGGQDKTINSDGSSDFSSVQVTRQEMNNIFQHINEVESHLSSNKKEG